MNDRELLELAAKAAGYINWTPMQSCLFIETGHSRGDTGFHWNPLTDDGDALRLAVKLKLQPLFTNATVIVHDFDGDQLYMCGIKKDPYAATRRAIVRAAAEIGKGMK